MHLVMFDLDGTLMRSNTLDVHVFGEAVRQVLGVAKIESDWARYRHVTDEGIICEIVSQALGGPADENVVLQIRRKIHQLLQREIAANAWKFRAIPGAIELLDRLRALEACGVAIATGSWKESAYLKLSAAGFDTAHLPLASSDDSFRRDEIMAAAWQRSKVFYGVPAFDTVTYVGDGMWDLSASQKMGYHFIGIGVNHTRTRMMAQGAVRVFADFRRPGEFFEEMDRIWAR